jgi:electron transfer flavoprotein alpha/beta subunit
MDILVCFTIAPALDQMPESVWLIQENDSARVDARFLPTRINAYDESALELALRLAPAAPGPQPFRLTALTIGGAGAERFLRTLYALRFDAVVRVETQEDLRFRPARVAAILAAWTREHMPHGVAILGRQGGEGDNGQTAYRLAEALHWPCVSELVAIARAGDAALRVTSRTDSGLLTRTVTPPCVLTVGEVANCLLRAPTLKDRMQFGRRAVHVVDAETLGAAHGPDEPQPQALAPLRNDRRGVVLDGADPDAAARQLYDGYLRGWRTTS